MQNFRGGEMPPLLSLNAARNRAATNRLSTVNAATIAAPCSLFCSAALGVMLWRSSERNQSRLKHSR